MQTFTALPNCAAKVREYILTYFFQIVSKEVKKVFYIIDYWAKAKALTGVGERAPAKNKKKDKLGTTHSAEEDGPVLSEAEIKRRRYTAFMSDMVW